MLATNPGDERSPLAEANGLELAGPRLLQECHGLRIRLVVGLASNGVHPEREDTGEGRFDAVGVEAGLSTSRFSSREKKWSVLLSMTRSKTSS